MSEHEKDMARTLELWRDQVCLTAHSLSVGLLVARPGSPWTAMAATSHLVGLRSVVSHISEFIGQLTGETAEEQAEHSCMSGIEGGTKFLIDILRPQMATREIN